MAATKSMIGKPKRHVSTLHTVDAIVEELIADLDLTAGERLRRVDPTLADLFDQIDERLRAAQDEETAKHVPVDLDAAAMELAEARTELLISGGDLIDEVMHLAELGVGVARQVATIETTKRMADAEPAQPALPRPPDPFDGGDDTEDFHGIRAANTAPIHGGVWDENWNWAAPTEPPKPTLAVRVGGWWQRTRLRARHAYARVAVSLLVAAGLSWGIG